jgi:hypothetical protein
MHAWYSLEVDPVALNREDRGPGAKRVAVPVVCIAVQVSLAPESWRGQFTGFAERL